MQIAKKVGKSAAAVMIRWGIQRGYIVIPSAPPLLPTSNFLVPCQAPAEAQTAMCVEQKFISRRFWGTTACCISPMQLHRICMICRPELLGTSVCILLWLHEAFHIPPHRTRITRKAAYVEVAVTILYHPIRKFFAPSAFLTRLTVAQEQWRGGVQRRHQRSTWRKTSRCWTGSSRRRTWAR